ncbi:hypothetical protein Mal4_23450 [Maioricimonas rarisocia]|uniref:Uncharacterized protein n=1 Tax=Maioricimonas rarisocia TaxID=2528026 RepID=A0A517Z6D1_9PLAN|nr:hypothetical protein Mal4_23450 [Maioricimonas rarisocia]
MHQTQHADQPDSDRFHMAKRSQATAVCFE